MEPLDERYLVWLYRLVADPAIESRELTYWELFRQLYEKQFVWIISRDDNRIEDGKQLRLEFLSSEGLTRRDVDPNWIELGCSVLELMIAMSYRLVFETDPDGQPAYWFWKLAENIGIGGFNDASGYEHCDVDEILNRVIFRQYEPDGTGGFFPLKDPRADQRSIELWYQLNAYVREGASQ
jgi:hypothetical protein